MSSETSIDPAATSQTVMLFLESHARTSSRLSRAWTVTTLAPFFIKTCCQETSEFFHTSVIIVYGNKNLWEGEKVWQTFTNFCERFCISGVKLANYRPLHLSKTESTQEMIYLLAIICTELKLPNFKNYFKQFKIQGGTKKRSSPKIEWLPKFYLDWHKTSATLGQACVADISKVSSLYYKNSLFHWRSKNVLQMSSPALKAHLDPAGKVLDDPPAFLPWDCSYCCFDCCHQVRDSLGVVAIHPVLKVSPQIKIWGGSSPVNAATTAGHTCRWSVGQRNAAVAMPMIRLSCGGWHHPAGTTGGP